MSVRRIQHLISVPMVFYGGLVTCLLGSQLIRVARAANGSCHLSEELAYIADQDFSSKWSERATIESVFDVRPLELSSDHIENDVYVTRIGGKKYIFRPANGNKPSQARHTFAAAKLNSILGIKTVPNARVVKIGHQTGVLSDFVSESLLRKTFRGKKGNAASTSDASAFEFLIGNDDVHSRNFYVTFSGTIVVFDHDVAFNVNPKQRSPSYFGSELPHLYTHSFIEKLTRLTRIGLELELGDHLTADELNAVWKRRAKLLEDAKDKPKISP